MLVAIPARESSSISVPEPTTPKTAAELTVRDVVSAYDYSGEFDAPAKPGAPVPAETDVLPHSGAKTQIPAKDPETGRFVAAPKHSAYWLKRATEAGIDEADIAAMSTEELTAAVRHESGAKRKLGVDTSRANQTTAEPPPLPEPPIAIGDDDFDAPLVKILRHLQARLDAVENREARRNNQAVVNKLDGMFSKDKDIFGEGPTEDLDENSAEYARRQMVMSGLMGLAQTGKRSTLAKDYAKLAVAFKGVVAPKAPKKSAEAELEPSEVAPKNGSRLTAEQEAWLEGGHERPTHRAATELAPGVNKAKQTFSRGVRQLEVTRPASATDENDELPG